MTLSVMDDIDFTTTYQCVKCEKLETDLKTSKSEVADLRNLVTVMRAQTAKTAALLQKFETTKKTMLLQKQKIETLEKQNDTLKVEAKTVNLQLNKFLDSTEGKNSQQKDEQIESQRNNLKSQATVIEQYKVQFLHMEKELDKHKTGKKDAEKSCKDLQAKITKLNLSIKELKEKKSDKSGDLSETISKLRSEIGVLKRENTRLKNTREETVNRLAEKKKDDIAKKLAAFTCKQTNLETTIEKTIERTIQKNLKGFLETVTSPVKAAGSGMFRSPPPRGRRRSTKSTEEGTVSGGTVSGGAATGASPPKKKRGRPWKRQPMATTDEDSDLESISRPQKSVKRPIQRRVSQPKGKKKAPPPLAQESGHLSNSSSDDDVDLVGQLEESFRVQIAAKCEPDGVLVCDPLPSTSSALNLFDQQDSEAPDPPKASRNLHTMNQEVKESPLTQKKLPTVLNVNSIFRLMVSSAELSPLKTRQDRADPCELAKIKSEDHLETTPPAVTSDAGTAAPTANETSSSETANSSPPEIDTVCGLKTSPKKETPCSVSLSESDSHQIAPEIVPETPAITLSFQPISIKNEMKKTKSEPNDPVITLKPRSSKEARAAPIVSTLGELLSPSKVRPDSTPSPATPTSDVEIVSVVNVEREEPSVSASDSQTEDDLPEISVAEVSASVTEPKMATLESQSALQKLEDNTPPRATTTEESSFNAKAFVPLTPQQLTSQGTKEPVKPNFRIPPISMCFVRPKLSSSLLQESVVPAVVDEVNQTPVSTAAVSSTSSAPSLAAKQEDVNKASLPDDRVSSPNVSALPVPLKSREDTKSSIRNPQESDGHPAKDSSLLKSSVQITPAPAKKLKTEKSPSRKQSEVNVTLSGDSLVTPTTPTEVVVSEDVMVCAFEVDVGAASMSSQSDVDTQSDSAADVDVSETSKHSDQSETQFERPSTRSRKSNSASFVAPKRVRTRRSTSQEEQPVIFTKCLRNRKVSFSEESTEAPKRRRSARTSSVSDVSDNNDSPGPRRSRRIQSSTSPSPAKTQKPKQRTKKKIPDAFAPEELVIEENILGAEDRNVMIPEDLLELKKSIEEIRLQENQMKGLESADSSELENESSIIPDTSLTNIPAQESTESDSVTDSSAPPVTPSTPLSDKSSPDEHNSSVVATSCADECNGAKAVEQIEENSVSDLVQVKEITKPSSEKRKALRIPVTPSLKTVPAPSFDWHAAKSLDLDLTPVTGKLPDTRKPATLNKVDNAAHFNATNSDESLVEDSSLMIADNSVMSQVVEDVTIDEGTAPSIAVTSDPLAETLLDLVTPAERDNTVKVVVPPVSKWFSTESSTVSSTLLPKKLPSLNAVSENSDLEISSNDVTTESRKRKKTKGPAHKVSLSQIFDIFVPNKTISPLLLARDNEHLVMENSDTECQTPSGSSFNCNQTSVVSVDVKVLSSLRKKTVVPTLPVDDEPLYHPTHEDYTHLVPQCTTKYLVQMFRKNLCTSAPNVPYIIETILYNHKNKSLQNVDQKLISVIRNEISIRDTSPADVPIPPIDVLVEFFFDLFTRLTQTGYSYFDPKTWKSEILKRLFVQISAMKKNITKSFVSILSFATKLSMKCEDLKYLRAYVINMIHDMNYKFVCELFNKCFCSYSVYLLIGEQHLSLSKDGNSIRDVSCLYLTGLEFYLRYTQLKFTPIEQLTYVHQFAVEHHLINAALEAVSVKEELQPGTHFKCLKDQGVMCIKLMVKSQGWPWFTATVLPAIFDKLSTTTEFGICRLTELITTLVTAEIVSYRAGGDVNMLKEKLIPALIGLLWTAPTVDIKICFARCLVQLSPLNPSFVSSSLENWISCVPQQFKEHHLYPELTNMINFIVERQDSCNKKSRTL